jgi:hypothetical protein
MITEPNAHPEPLVLETWSFIGLPSEVLLTKEGASCFEPPFPTVFKGFQGFPRVFRN